MNGYELSRKFVDFSFENPSKIKPVHYALYFFSIEHCNRLGWKKEFGLPTTMTMEAIGIRSYNTYSKTFNDLVRFGFFNLIEKSKNQYSANIIALSNFNKALDKALDKAFIKHSTKQSESTLQSIDSIIKQINNKQYNKEQLTRLNDALILELSDTDVKIDYKALVDYFNSVTGKSTRVVNNKTKQQLNARLKEGYTKEDIMKAINTCYNDSYHKDTKHKFLTLEFISRSDKLDKFSSMSTKELTLQELIRGKTK